MHINIYSLWENWSWSYWDIVVADTEEDDGIRQNESKTVFTRDWGLGFAQEPPADMTCFYRQYLDQTPKSRQLQGGCRDSHEQIEKA